MAEAAAQRVLARSVEQQLEDHRGQWVAIVGAKIVAWGDDPAKVVRKAMRQRPRTRPILHWVPDDEAEHFFF